MEHSLRVSRRGKRMQPLNDPSLYGRMVSSAQQVILWVAGNKRKAVDRREGEREKAITLDSKCHVARKWSRKPGMKLDAVFLNLLPGVNRDAAPQSNACERVLGHDNLPQSPPSSIFASCLAWWYLTIHPLCVPSATPSHHVAAVLL